MPIFTSWDARPIFHVDVGEGDGALHLPRVGVVGAAVVLGRVEEAGVVALDGVEGLRGAILTGGVEAQPVVQLVADTAAHESGIAEAALVEAGIRHRDVRVEGGADVGAQRRADTDVAAQVPAAELDGLGSHGLDRRRIRQGRGLGGSDGAEGHRSREKKGVQLAHGSSPR